VSREIARRHGMTRTFASKIPVPRTTRIYLNEAEEEPEEELTPEFEVSCVSTSGKPVPQVLETKRELMWRAWKDAGAHISVAPVARFTDAVLDGICHGVEVALVQNDLNVPVVIEERYAASKVQGASGPAPNVLLDEGLENLVYLDDSDSMAGPNLIEGRCILARIVQDIGKAPTRIVKFGFQPRVLTDRVNGDAVADSLYHALDVHWNGNSGGTYMWKMIELDIKGKYRAGDAKLRVFILTDGMDQLSPRKYQGLKGIDRMMKKLQKQGFDIEFYIVVIGRVARRDEDAFKRLAAGTGGGFLRVGWLEQYDDAAPDSKAFMAAVASSSSTAEAAIASRRQRQLAYEKEVPVADRPKWYKALPSKKSATMVGLE